MMKIDRFTEICHEDVVGEKIRIGRRIFLEIFDEDYQSCGGLLLNRISMEL